MSLSRSGVCELVRELRVRADEWGRSLWAGGSVANSVCQNAATSSLVNAAVHWQSTNHSIIPERQPPNSCSQVVQTAASALRICSERLAKLHI